jgi:mono/diheme cytochrome c family protein
MSPKDNSAFFITLFFMLALAATAAIPVHNYHSVHQDKPWVAPKWVDTISAPNLSNPSFIQGGKDLFFAQCSVCHGENGKGDGEAGFGLTVPPGDLTESSVIAESNGSLFWKISTGRSPMPSYTEKLNEQELWSLVSFVRNLQEQHVLKIESKKNRKNK